MDIERAELLVTLKGKKVWKKGTIFDPKKDGHPIPPDIIAEVRANTGTVKVLGALTEVAADDKTVAVEAELAEAKAKLAVAGARVAEIEAEAKDEEAPLKGADILRMNRGQILDLLKNEEDFESIKDEKRTILVGIARKRLVKNDQS